MVRSSDVSEAIVITDTSSDALETVVRDAQTFMTTSELYMPADTAAQDAYLNWQAAQDGRKVDRSIGPPRRYQIVVKSSDVPTKPGGHLAIWIDRSRDGGKTWEEGGDVIGRTGKGGLLGLSHIWDGQDTYLKVTVCTSIACELGVSASVI